MKHFRACCVSLFAAILGACAEDPAAPARSSIEGRIQYTDGQPAEGVVVIVGNKPPVNSDAAGMFRVDRVGPTYDITLLNGASALVYSGLTRRDPFFEFWGGGLGRGGFNPPFVSFSTATISGVVPPAADKTRARGGLQHPAPSVRERYGEGGSPRPVVADIAAAASRGLPSVIRERRAAAM